MRAHGNRGINSSKPCSSYERNLAYLKSRAGQKILVMQCPARQSLHRVSAEALRNHQAEKAHEAAQQHENAIKNKSTVGYRGATTCNARLKSAPNNWFKTLAALTGTG